MSSEVTDASGNVITAGDQRYMPFGMPRLTASLPTDRLFTGQRDIAALGLMDYHARMYDALLGRFIQPDRTVSNPSEPQSLDKYSYVKNNPITFDDPSGNDPTCTDLNPTSDMCHPVVNICLNNESDCQSHHVMDRTKPSFTLLDRGKLNSRANNSYDLYISMYDDRNGWWWNTYGNDGNFTIWDFMAIMWSYDARLNDPLVVQAMHNRAYTFCPAGCDPTTAEGSLIFMSTYAESATRRIDSWKPGTDPTTVIDNSVNNPQIGEDIVTAIRTSSKLTDKGLNALSPYDYGNISLNLSVYGKMVGNGWVLQSIPAPSGNTFFVLSRCQYYMAQFAIQKGISPTESLYSSYCG